MLGRTRHAENRRRITAKAGFPHRFRLYGQEEVQPFSQGAVMRHRNFDAFVPQETRKTFSAAFRIHRALALATRVLTATAVIAAVSLLSAELVYSSMPRTF